MSSVIEEYENAKPLMSLADVAVEKHHVRGAPYGIILPFSFGTIKEVKSFIEELKGLYGDDVESRDRCVFITLRKGFPFREKYGLKVRKSDDGKIELYNYYAGREKFSVSVDTILRNTIIGKKLMEYWIKEDAITESESQKRLEEIAPLTWK